MECLSLFNWLFLVRLLFHLFEPVFDKGTEADTGKYESVPFLCVRQISNSNSCDTIEHRETIC